MFIWSQDDELESTNRILVQVAEQMEGHVYCTVYTPVGSVGGLWAVQQQQQWVVDGFELEQHKTPVTLLHRVHGVWSVIIKGTVHLK